MKVFSTLLPILLFGLIAVSAYPREHRRDHVHKSLEHAKDILRKQIQHIIDWLEHNHNSQDRGSKNCSEEYQKKVDQIFNETSLNVDQCLEDGESSLAEIEYIMSENRRIILIQKEHLQQNLERCTFENGTDFFDCYVNSVSLVVLLFFEKFLNIKIVFLV